MGDALFSLSFSKITIMKRLQFLILSLLLVTAASACDANGADSKSSKKARADEMPTPPSPDLTVLEKWDMPEILREVSGIAYLGDNLFGCVQDEAGVIFLYDTKAGQIKRQITFGAAGDYEGIALVGTTAYVVRSDGQLFEVTNINAQQNKISEFATTLPNKSDVEGLAYDAKNNRLLLALKDEKTADSGYKSIYAFNLKTKQMEAQPVFKLNLSDPLLVKKPTKKKKKDNSLSKAWQPSEIAVHPVTGEIYLTEASNPQLFILNQNGTIKERHQLDTKVFTQPEGLSFSPSGEMYISNEGKKEPGNILRVQLK